MGKTGGAGLGGEVRADLYMLGRRYHWMCKWRSEGGSWVGLLIFMSFSFFFFFLSLKWGQYLPFSEFSRLNEYQLKHLKLCPVVVYHFWKIDWLPSQALGVSFELLNSQARIYCGKLAFALQRLAFSLNRQKNFLDPFCNSWAASGRTWYFGSFQGVRGFHLCRDIGALPMWHQTCLLISIVSGQSNFIQVGGYCSRKKKGSLLSQRLYYFSFP